MEENSKNKVSKTTKKIKDTQKSTEKEVQEIKKVKSDKKETKEVKETKNSKNEIKENITEIKEDFIENKKSKFKKWFLIPIFLIIIISLFLVYYFIIASPKNMLKSLSNNLFEEFKENSNETKEEFSKLIIDGNANFTFDQTNVNSEYYLGYDKNTNDFYTQIDTQIDKEKFLEFEFSQKNNILYMFSKQFYDKVLKFEDYKDINVKLDTNKLSLNNKEIIYIMELYKDTFNENIKNFDLSKKIMKKNIDGKSRYVNKINVKISNKNMNEIYLEFLDKLKKDKKAITILNKVNIDSNSLNAVKLDDKDKTKYIKFEIYTSLFKNEFLAFELINNQGSLKMNKINEGISVSFEVKDMLLKFDIVIVDKITKINGYMTNKSISRINYTYKFSFKFNNENKKNSRATFNIDVFVAPIEKSLINLNGSFIVKLDEEFKNMDITNSIDFDKLSDAEKEKLANKILEFSNKFFPSEEKAVTY